MTMLDPTISRYTPGDASQPDRYRVKWPQEPKPGDTVMMSVELFQECIDILNGKKKELRPPTYIEAGKAAYDAYCLKTGTKEQLPPWEKLHWIIQDAWIGAATAVIAWKVDKDYTPGSRD